MINIPNLPKIPQSKLTIDVYTGPGGPHHFTGVKNVCFDTNKRKLTPIVYMDRGPQITYDAKILTNGVLLQPSSYKNNTLFLDEEGWRKMIQWAHPKVRIGEINVI